MFHRFPFLFLFLLSACATTPAFVSRTSTPDPIQAYVNAGASQATAVSAIATADYFGHQLTATVEARDQNATQQAWSVQTTATERVWDATATANSIQSTSTAIATGTARAIQATATQHAFEITSTADAAAVQAYATQQYAVARTEQLSLQRQELMNNVVAVTPWMMFGITFIAAIVLVFRWTRVRVIQRAPNGDAPLLLDVVDGIAFDADRHPSSTAGLMRRDLKQLPTFSSSEHLKITTQDQTIDLAARLPESHRSKERLTLASPSAESNPQVQIITEAQAQVWLKDVLPHLYQDAIEGEIVSPEGIPNHD
jgi:hypothetical protein